MVTLGVKVAGHQERSPLLNTTEWHLLLQSPSSVLSYFTELITFYLKRKSNGFYWDLFHTSSNIFQKCTIQGCKCDWMVQGLFGTCEMLGSIPGSRKIMNVPARWLSRSNKCHTGLRTWVQYREPMAGEEHWNVALWPTHGYCGTFVTSHLSSTSTQ